VKKTITILLITGLMVAAAGCTSSDGSGVQNVKASEDTSIIENSNPEEQTTTPVKGSFKNSASMGETVVLAAPGGSYEYQLLMSKEERSKFYCKESKFI
jgi:ABC-type Fe3+-hydroxamate transport system substrate-binding protein